MTTLGGGRLLVHLSHTGALLSDFDQMACFSQLILLVEELGVAFCVSQRARTIASWQPDEQTLSISVCVR